MFWKKKAERLIFFLCFILQDLQSVDQSKLILFWSFLQLIGLLLLTIVPAIFAASIEIETPEKEVPAAEESQNAESLRTKRAGFSLFSGALQVNKQKRDEKWNFLRLVIAILNSI